MRPWWWCCCYSSAAAAAAADAAAAAAAQSVLGAGIAYSDRSATARSGTATAEMRPVMVDIADTGPTLFMYDISAEAFGNDQHITVICYSHLFIYTYIYIYIRLFILFYVFLWWVWGGLQNQPEFMLQFAYV